MVAGVARARSTVPPTIQALLAARLDQLAGRERAVLERGAVEGQVFHRGAVAALAPDDPTSPRGCSGSSARSWSARAAATLPGDDAFRFRHLLIRDAAYDALPKATRAELHERFADWLEEHGARRSSSSTRSSATTSSRRRATGAELGSPSPALQERAAQQLAAAACAPARVRMRTRAWRCSQRASTLLDPDDPRRLALLPTLGQALYALGRLDDAYRTFDEAIERADPDTAARAYFMKTAVRGHGESISPYEIERDVRSRAGERWRGRRATDAGGRLQPARLGAVLERPARSG